MTDSTRQLSRNEPRLTSAEMEVLGWRVMHNDGLTKVEREIAAKVILEVAAELRGEVPSTPSEKRASAPPAIFTEGTHVVRPRWIPVTEKVPSETRDQIICLAFSPTDADGDDSVPGAFVASYDDGEWCSRMDSGCWEPGDVTHWMPFPDGPALEANRQEVQS